MFCVSITTTHHARRLDPTVCISTIQTPSDSTSPAFATLNIHHPAASTTSPFTHSRVSHRDTEAADIDRDRVHVIHTHLRYTARQHPHGGCSRCCPRDSSGTGRCCSPCHCSAPRPARFVCWGPATGSSRPACRLHRRC